MSTAWVALRPRRSNVRTTPLVSPPVALTIDVFARILAEVGRADDEDLEALWPGLVASPRAGRDPHRVPFFELDDLVVDLHPRAPAQDHVHLLLLHVRVAVRKAIAGRDTLVAQGGFLELERLGRRAELQVRRAVEPRADVLQILLDVAERERHGAILWCHTGTLAQPRAQRRSARRGEERRRAALLQSPLTDSNRRPPPYHSGTKPGSAGTAGSPRPRKRRKPRGSDTEE